MEDKEILKLLRSGKFTIITWDNWSYTVYPWRFLEADNDEVWWLEWFDVNWKRWYMPKIVELMAEALWGSTDSI